MSAARSAMLTVECATQETLAVLERRAPVQRQSPVASATEGLRKAVCACCIYGQRERTSTNRVRHTPGARRRGGAVDRQRRCAYIGPAKLLPACSVVSASQNRCSRTSSKRRVRQERSARCAGGQWRQWR